MRQLFVKIFLGYCALTIVGSVHNTARAAGRSAPSSMRLPTLLWTQPKRLATRVQNWWTHSDDKLERATWQQLTQSFNTAANRHDLETLRQTLYQQVMPSFVASNRTNAAHVAKHLVWALSDVGYSGGSGAKEIASAKQHVPAVSKRCRADATACIAAVDNAISRTLSQDR